MRSSRMGSVCEVGVLAATSVRSGAPRSGGLGAAAAGAKPLRRGVVERGGDSVDGTHLKLAHSFGGLIFRPSAIRRDGPV